MNNGKIILRENLHLHKAHDFCAVDKPALTAIFIHGIAADATSFDPALKYLESLKKLEGVRFVAFDLLGSGHSIKADDELDYGLEEQLTALNKSIEMLDIKTPIVLVGHSMGTIIATRYTDTHRRMIDELVLISPPLYRPEDFENPMFAKAIDGFREVVGRANGGLLEDKAFNNELKQIVSNPHNYGVLAGLNKPITIIYGELDQIIAPFNIPKLLQENPTIVVHKTTGGRHGVGHDKFGKLAEALEIKLSEIKKETA